MLSGCSNWQVVDEGKVYECSLGGPSSRQLALEHSEQLLETRVRVGMYLDG
jgi:hypothetical protein